MSVPKSDIKMETWKTIAWKIWSGNKQGRIFETEEVEPVIFDLVDSFKPLQSHYYERQKVYREHGGKIEDFWHSFPKFSRS